jgi:hypothetical protein
LVYDGSILTSIVIYILLLSLLFRPSSLMHSLASPSPVPSLLLPFVSVRTLPGRAGSAHFATGMLALPDTYYARSHC